MQILRAAAAIAVATAHIPQIDKLLPGAAYGAVGVDLFFVISGFVMVYSSKPFFETTNGYRLFLGRRIARIVPIYWIASLWMCVFYLIHAGPGVPKVTWSWMLSSLSFVPFGDGAVEPITGVGWTLNFEMFFYVCFAGTLILPMARSAAVLTVMFVVFAALWKLNLTVLPFSFWFHPIIIEFLFGIWLAVAYRRELRLSPVLCGAMVASGIALYIAGAVAGYYATPADNSFFRFAIWGGPALLIVAGCVLAPRPLPDSRTVWLLVLLGDASYCIYLIHPMLEYHINQFVHAYVGLTMRAIITLLLVIVVSVAIHLCLERPMTEYFRNLLVPRRIGAAIPSLSPGGPN